MTGDKDIIDLTPYLEGSRAEEDSAFAVFGGSGAGSRFALPIWRSIYLAGGDRGAVLSVPQGADQCVPIFVLDLKVDPARLDFPVAPSDLADSLPVGTRLAQDEEEGDWAAVLLGERAGAVFFSIVTGMKDPLVLEDPGVRQDFLFLSGECAGLILHWELDKADPSRL